jgi:hypothetical protein
MTFSTFRPRRVCRGDADPNGQDDREDGGEQRRLQDHQVEMPTVKAIRVMIETVRSGLRRLRRSSSGSGP